MFTSPTSVAGLRRADADVRTLFGHTEKDRNPSLAILAGERVGGPPGDHECGRLKIIKV
jgi:hypothetical protein